MNKRRRYLAKRRRDLFRWFECLRATGRPMPLVMRISLGGSQPKFENFIPDLRGAKPKYYPFMGRA